MKILGRTRGRVIHLLFDFGVLFKGIDGILEIIGATLLSVTSPAQLAHWITVLTQHEISEDPQDFVATHLREAAHHLSVGQQTFAVLYLLSHGILKILLVSALLAERLWAYPVAIVVFFVFGVYQTYRFTFTHEPGLIALTVLDIFVIVLTWLEYQRLKSQ